MIVIYHAHPCYAGIACYHVRYDVCTRDGSITPHPAFFSPSYSYWFVPGTVTD